jgi:hypothetical protein
MPDARDKFEPLKRFRLLAVRLTLVITIVVAGLTWFFDSIAAQGILLGGFAGVLGFWIIATRLEKVARINPEKVHFAALTWSMYRFALYGIVLYKAFSLDPDTYHGILGGVIGIMMIRFVLVIVGVTGLDKRLWKDAAADNDGDSTDASQEADE